jgi:hypothetical protein
MTISRRTTFALLAVGLLALAGSAIYLGNHGKTLVASPAISSSPTPWPTPTSDLNVKTPARHVFTYDCEYPNSYKPDMLFFACADGNTGIRGIHWNTWTPLSAEATGTYFENNCTPDCAEGKFSFTPVVLWLDTPIQMGSDIYLTQLGYQQIDVSGKEVTGGISGSNDMAEMYINMYQESASPTPAARKK